MVPITSDVANVACQVMSLWSDDQIFDHELIVPLQLPANQLELMVILEWAVDYSEPELATDFPFFSPFFPLCKSTAGSRLASSTEIVRSTALFADSPLQFLLSQIRHFQNSENAEEGKFSYFFFACSAALRLAWRFVFVKAPFNISELPVCSSV